ncbi:MAG: hypothetical protein DRO40_01200 [Thermoprotei archaeon]|nr:MAG: hypothetical protein DRO40_01200 [Thermoprotei archaeon]
MAEVDYISNNTTLSLTETKFLGEEKASIAKAIADLLAIASAYHDISRGSERKHAEELMKTLVYKWLELITPIQYVPGLIDELSRIIRRPFWDLYTVLGEDFMNELIQETIVFKEKALTVKDDSLCKYTSLMEAKAIKLLSALSDKDHIDLEDYPVLATIFSENGCSSKLLKLITLVLQAILISFNFNDLE